MSVVVILASITFGIVGGVYNAQARSQAKAELAIIARGLESFKSLYGDYPYVSGTNFTVNGNELLVALTGWSNLQRTGSNPEMVDLSKQGKTFINTELLSLSVDQEMPDGGAPGVSFYLVDPWGNPYVYIYNKNGSSWDNFGYILLSSGPDGDIKLSGVQSDGIIDQDWRKLAENNDNIYTGN